MKTYKALILIVLLIFTCSITSAQKYSSQSKKAIKHFEEALAAYERTNDAYALAELEKTINADANFLEAYLLRAQIYQDKEEYRLEIENYNKMLEINRDFYPTVFYYLADAELSIGDYEKASEHFVTFLESMPDSELRPKAIQRLKSARFATVCIENPVPFNPINLGDMVNSANMEYLPAISTDSKTLIITVCVKLGEGFEQICQEDFFVSQKLADGSWSEATNIGAPINTPENEGAQCISADGQFFFFTACNRSDGYGSCDIYFARKTGNGWTTPQNLGRPVNSDAWESQPSFASDGRTLYFASNRGGSRGKKDIWKTELQDNGTWSRPENLGDSINTPENDMSPFIHQDNQTLYFSSDGHPGMGKLDLFVSRKNVLNRWQKPMNLGYPINTFQEESSLIINLDGDKAYYATERPNGFGGLDLYEFDLYEAARPQEVTYLQGTVFDAKTQKRLSARFELIDVGSNTNIVTSFSNATTGQFLLCLPKGKTYALNVAKDGYLFYSDNFVLDSLKRELGKGSPFLKDIALEPIEVGKRVILKNIFFDTNKFELKPQSEAELQKLVAFLKRNSKLKIEIGGHTDNQGTQELNEKLSLNRSKSVYEYLIAHSIEKERLSYAGYGFSQPIATNDTGDGRAQNRRTEFRIVE